MPKSPYMTNDFKKEVARYALYDAKATFMLWKEHGHKMPDHEWRISRMTREMGMRGVPVNVEKLKAAEAKLIEEKRRTEALLPWIGGEYPPLSLQAIRDQCEKEGIRSPKSFAEKDPEGAAWEAEFADKFPWVRAVRDYRKANKHLKTVQAMIARTRPDGRMGYELKYFGAHCVTGDHEVFTKNGWVRIDQWEGGEIAQWSPDGALQFLPATANQFKADQELFRLESPYAAGVFTAGHTIPYFKHSTKLFATRSAREASTRGSYYAPVSGKLLGNGNITAAQMRVLVATQADGHWDGDGILRFEFRKSRKVERIKRLLETAGLPYRVHCFPCRPEAVRISVSRRNCPEWLTPARKRFGVWLLDSTEDAREAFMDELPHWDGWRHPTNPQYYSSVQENIDWVSTMAHLCGRSCGKIIEKNSGFADKAGNFALAIRQTNECMVFRKHWAPAPKADRVFCPTTQTGFWLYRYKGKIAVTGNTGRDSGGGGWNAQNIPKGEVAGVDIRNLIEAPAGNTLVICDLAQIEARCLPYLAGDKELLKLIASGLDVYEAHARATMDYNDPRPLKEVDPKLRQVAKARTLGAGYGVGAAKFQLVAKIMAGLDISLQEAQETVQAYRDSNPKIVALWRRMDRELRVATDPNDKTLEVTLPSGRSLIYRNVRRVTGNIVAKMPRLGKLMDVKLYGAQIVENMCQGFARDVFMDRCMALEDAGYEILMRVHDEVVVLVDEYDAEDHRQVIEEIMSTPPLWASDLPLGAEAIISKHYRK